MNCCAITNMVLGITESGDPVVPPVLSDYCVQWATVNRIDNYWPCTGASFVAYVNDNNNPTDICAGQFNTADYLGNIGTTFSFDYYGDGLTAYYQVIRPIADPALAVLGTWSYDDAFGTFGPIDVTPTDENCTLNCYTATFDVDSVSTDGFSGVIVQFASRQKDLFINSVVPFDDPTAEAEYLAELISLALVEPSATVSVTINSPTNVTLTICTILTLFGGDYGDAVTTKGTFNFTAI